MKHLHPLYSEIAPPERFTYPFCYEPHPLCQLAAKEVQAYIATHPEIRQDADQGKMFGVLVVDLKDFKDLKDFNDLNNLSHTLDGRPVVRTASGIYILNGKKFIVK